MSIPVGTRKMVNYAWANLEEILVEARRCADVQIGDEIKYSCALCLKYALNQYR